MSLTRAFQWSAITLVLAALVGFNYDFDSKAGMRMNASLDDPLSQSLRGYWKLDEGTGTSTTADTSGNANTLSMTGPPTWTTGTIGPSAMDFSGSGQYLSVASPASGVLDFAAGASFSITGWFNRDTFIADHTIVAKRNGQTATDDGYIVYIDDATDTLIFEASDTADTDEYQRVSTSAFTATGWHQFAVTWNDSATTDPVNIFIDGALNNGTATGTFANMGDLTESVAFRIGAESDAGVPFDGKIDDVRVYGYPLSASDVLKLYQTTAPTQPVDTGLVGHWTFDGPDIQGTTAIDRSSFGNNGTITGATKTIGKLGQGLSFDGGDDLITLGGTSIPNNLTTNFSVSSWVYLSGTDWHTDRNFHVILQQDSGPSYTTHFDVWVKEYSTGDSTNFGFDSDVMNITSNASLSVGKWEFIVITYDGSNLKTFYNGVFDNQATETDSTTDGSRAPWIGFGSSGNPLLMAPIKLDDLRVYNRALSAMEIADFYNMGK